MKKHLTENTPAIVFYKKLPTIKHLRQLLIGEAMKRANGNKTTAAGMLGISRQALSKQLKSIFFNGRNSKTLKQVGENEDFKKTIF